MNSRPVVNKVTPALTRVSLRVVYRRTPAGGPMSILARYHGRAIARHNLYREPPGSVSEMRADYRSVFHETSFLVQFLSYRFLYLDSYVTCNTIPRLSRHRQSRYIVMRYIGIRYIDKLGIVHYRGNAFLLTVVMKRPKGYYPLATPKPFRGPARRAIALRFSRKNCQLPGNSHVECITCSPPFSARMTVTS